MDRSLKYFIRLIKYGVWCCATWLCLCACRKTSVFQHHDRPETILQAGDARLMQPQIHFRSDTVYVLAVNLVVDSGRALQIDAGTLIKINNNITVTIQRGATVQAVGTSSAPIIFTSSAFTGGAGQVGGYSGQPNWGGLRVFGSGHSSGSLQFVRIEFAGDENFIYPSLLLDHVTADTKIDHVQVSYSFVTPSFEFAGGNVNAFDLVSYACNGNADFLLHQGYVGKLQQILAYRHPYFPNANLGANLAGLLLQDTATFPIISNATVIGPDLQKGTDTLIYGNTSGRVAALVTTAGTRFHIRNSVLLGFPKGGWFLDDKVTALSLNSGESDFKYSIVHSNDSSRAFFLSPSTYPPFTSKDFKSYVLQASFGNAQFFSDSTFQLTDPFNYDIAPNPLPLSHSPLLTGAVFDDVFTDPFFVKTNFRGAFGIDNWMKGWSNFIPTQTNYNN